MQSHWVLNYAAVCKILCVPLHQGHVCHFPSRRLPGFPGHCTWAHWTEKEQKHSDNQFSLLVFIIPKATSVFFLSFLVFFFRWILIEKRKEEGRKKGGMERGRKERERDRVGREGGERKDRSLKRLLKKSILWPMNLLKTYSRIILQFVWWHFGSPASASWDTFPGTTFSDTSFSSFVWKETEA